MTELRYNIPDAELKNRGYSFQKLFARNYKTYRKELGAYVIWLWSKGKSIEVNDWHQNTAALLNFYKANKNIQDRVHSDCLKVQLNIETGFVQLYDYDEYYNVFKQPAENAWDSWNEKYGDWHNEIYLKKTEMDALIQEIEQLQTAR